jgi:hypothetical protein
MLMHFYDIVSIFNNNSGLATHLKHSEKKIILMSFNKLFLYCKGYVELRNIRKQLAMVHFMILFHTS